MANFVERYFRRNGTVPSQEQIQMAIDQGVITAEEAQSSLQSVNQIETRNAQSIDNKLGRTLATGANALLGGFGDEILDGLGASDAADTVRASEQRLAEENPLLSLGVQAAGAIVPGGAIAKGLQVARNAPLLGGVARFATNGNIRQGASLGAAEGALFGAGYSDDPLSERGDEALAGATLGAIGGAALTGLNPLARRLGLIRPDQTADANTLREVARRLGVTPEELVEQSSNGDDLLTIARRSSETDDEAIGAVNDISSISPRISQIIGRRANDSLDARTEDVRQRVRGLQSEISNDSPRPTQSGNEPFQNTTRLSQDGERLGEELGTTLRNKPVTPDFVDNLLVDNPARRMLVREINDVLRTDKDALLSNIVDDDSILEIRLSENGKPSGIYSISKGEDGEEFGELITLENGVSLDLFRRIAKSLRSKSEDKFGRNGNSKDTVVAEYEASLSKAINNNLREESDEVRSAFSNFVKNRSESDITVELAEAITNNNVNRLDQSSRKITRLIDTARKEGLDENEIRQIVRNGIRQGLDKGNPEETLKSLDSQQSLLYIREIFDKSNMDISADDFINSVRSNITNQKASQALDKAIRSSDPSKVSSRTLNAIDDLASDLVDNATTASQREVTERLVEGVQEASEILRETQKLVKLSNVDVEGVRRWYSRIADQIPMAVVVFGLTAKAMAVASLRGASQRGGFASFLTRRGLAPSEELLEALASSNDNIILTKATESAINKINGVDDRDWLELFGQSIIGSPVASAAAQSQILQRDSLPETLSGNDTSEGNFEENQEVQNNNIFEQLPETLTSGDTAEGVFEF